MKLKPAYRVLLLLVVAGGIAAVIYYWPTIVELARPGNRPDTVQAPAATQPAVTWAQPVQAPGLPNLHKVSDDLYRGAQPTAEGMKQLQAMGIKTVISLRDLHTDHDELKGTDLKHFEIPMNAAFNPKSEQVAEFFRIVGDPANRPVFVHCEHGSDRTGTMCALYRIAAQDWTPNQARAEMTRGGFGFHSIPWQHFADYIGKINAPALRQQYQQAQAGQTAARP